MYAQEIYLSSLSRRSFSLGFKTYHESLSWLIRTPSENIRAKNELKVCQKSKESHQSKDALAELPIHTWTLLWSTVVLDWRPFVIIYRGHAIRQMWKCSIGTYPNHKNESAWWFFQGITWPSHDSPMSGKYAQKRAKTGNYTSNYIRLI